MMTDKLNSISQNLIWLTVFLFPVAAKAIPGLLCLFGIIWIYKKQYRNVKNIDFKGFVYIGIALFSLNLIGMIYSDHIDLGRNELESKLTFAVLPLLLLSSDRSLIGNVRSLLIAFILGCAFASFICLGNASYNYMSSEPMIEHFFGAQLSILMHLGFFAFYLNFAVIICLHFLVNNDESQKFKRIIRLALLFLVAMILLTTSKMGIIILVMVSTIYGVFLIRQKNNLLKLLAAGGIFVLLFSIAWFSTNYFSYRFKEAYNSTFNQLEKDPSESTSIRRVAWGGVTEIIKENALIGVGTGDVKPELFETYKENGYTTALEKEIGPHSQYLQSFAEFGVLGLFAILLLVLYPIKMAVERRNLVLLVLGASLIVACITESILERQAGVLFFNFFFPILLYHSKQLSSNDSIFTSSL